MSLNMNSSRSVGGGGGAGGDGSSTTAPTSKQNNRNSTYDSNTSPTYCWEKIAYFYHTTRKPIHVLVSYDADAAAASLTFTSLLKSSLIDFSMQPVENYDEELRTIIEHTNLEQDYARSDPDAPLVDELFLLVGLGGTVPLEDYFDFTRHVVIVLDANRPFHLANLRADESRLLVWGVTEIRREVDVFFREQREREVRAGLRRQRRRRQRQHSHHHHHRHHRDHDDDDAEGRAKRQRKEAAALEKKQKKQTVLGGDDAEDGEQDDDDEDVQSSNAHSFTFSSSSSSNFSDDDDDDEYSLFSEEGDGEEDEDDMDLPLHLSQEELIPWRDGEDAVPHYMQRLYAAIDGCGRSCAVEAYDLAVLLHRFQNSFLWHAAVGVCDLLHRRRIDYGQYLVAMRPLHDAVSMQRHNGGGDRNNNSTTNNNNAAALEERDGVNLLSHRRRSGTHMTLQNRDEEQLYLLRHSSLWDAIWYHPLTASVLGLHHVEEGEGFLSQLLASRCGISRERARQPWRELPYEVQQDCLPHLLTELQHILHKKASFSAVPCQVRCLSRTVGYSTEVSTFDACALFAAVIAAVPSDALYVVENVQQLETDAAAAAALIKTRLREHQRMLFWKARDVLDVDPNDKLFRYAIQEAFTLQRSVAAATAALLQPGMVQSTRGVHYAQPSELARTTTALESFTSVYRLQPLATRLLFTLTVERGVSRYTQMVRPLLLSCLVPRPRAPAPTSADHSILASSAAASSTAAAAARAAAAGGREGAEAEYLVLLEHEGATGAGLAPLPAVGRFKECVSDGEEFVVLPRPCWTQPRCVVVEGRENAAHVAELMHLKSLEPWRPRQEEEAQQRRYSAVISVDDDNDDDDDDHHHDTNDNNSNDSDGNHHNNNTNGNNNNNHRTYSSYLGDDGDILVS